MLCESLDEPSCGEILFHGIIPAPSLPFPPATTPGIPERRVSEGSADDQAFSEDMRHMTPSYQRSLRRSRSVVIDLFVLQTSVIAIFSKLKKNQNELAHYSFNVCCNRTQQILQKWDGTVLTKVPVGQC